MKHTHYFIKLFYTVTQWIKGVSKWFHQHYFILLRVIQFQPLLPMNKYRVIEYHGNWTKIIVPLSRHENLHYIINFEGMVLPIFYEENAPGIMLREFYFKQLIWKCDVKTIDDGRRIFTIYLNNSTMHHNFTIERANTSARFLFHLTEIHPSNPINFMY